MEEDREGREQFCVQDLNTGLQNYVRVPNNELNKIIYYSVYM